MKSHTAAIRRQFPRPLRGDQATGTDEDYCIMCAVYRYANPHGHWSNDPGPFPDPRDTSYALQQLNRALTDREALRIAREISAMNDAGQIDLAWSLLKLTIG